MSKRLDELLEQIAKNGIFVINLFQTQQKFPDIRKKHWRCNLMHEDTHKIFDCGVGPTMEDALAAAIEKTHLEPIGVTPVFLRDKKPKVKEEKQLTMDDML